MCHEVLTNQTATTNAPAVVDRILPVTLASTLVDGATTTGDAYQCACNDCYNIKWPNPSASIILCKYCVRLALSDLLDLFLLLERSVNLVFASHVSESYPDL